MNELSQDERQVALKNIDEALQTRALFGRVFSTPDGIAVLTLIRRECGVESQNPEAMKPELVAFCNWLEYQIGILHPQHLYNVAAALVRAASDEDLYDEQAALQGEGGKHD
jgi:hypothetical protein